jgi:hypothetical protein
MTEDLNIGQFQVNHSGKVKETMKVKNSWYFLCSDNISILN